MELRLPCGRVPVYGAPFQMDMNAYGRVDYVTVNVWLSSALEVLVYDIYGEPRQHERIEPPARPASYGRGNSWCDMPVIHAACGCWIPLKDGSSLQIAREEGVNEHLTATMTIATKALISPVRVRTEYPAPHWARSR